MHRAQLVHREAAAVQARQARPIENRPLAGEADGQGGQSENRADNDQGQPREQYVEHAFDHVAAHAALNDPSSIRAGPLRRSSIRCPR